VRDAGGICCSFNSTVYEDTLRDLPALVGWAQRNIDMVHVMVFIAYRDAVQDGEFDYFCGGRRIDARQLVYAVEERRQRADISAPEMLAKVREHFPDFAPAAYLGGTEKPDSFKWLLATRIGTPARIAGYVGPRFIEAVQTTHHLWTGRYLAYADPRLLGAGRATLRRLSRTGQRAVAGLGCG